MKVAILSFAHPHSESYARILRDRDDVDLVVSDPDASSRGGRLGGRALADRLGVAYLDDYASAMEWAPDAVVVTAENSRHRALVELATRAGAHVLCEKPLATTMDDARAMVAAADSAGVWLMTAYPVRFAPEFLALRDQLRAGELGEVLAIYGTNNGKLPGDDLPWLIDEELAGGGAFVDHIVHCADLIDELLGERATIVRAASTRVPAPDVHVETGGLVTVSYPSAIVATIDCSWSWPQTSPSWGGLTLQVVTTTCTVTIDPFGRQVSGNDKHGEVHLGLSADLDVPMIDEFLSAIRERREPRPDGRTGLRSLEIVAAAQRSASDGQPVVLDSDWV